MIQALVVALGYSSDKSTLSIHAQAKNMKCSVYIATSLDGYIATPDGGVDWLHTAGNSDADLGDDADMGFAGFLDSVDCIIMGRKCMEMIASMNLTAEQWPYGDIPIVVLSTRMKEPPVNLRYCSRM